MNISFSGRITRHIWHIAVVLWANRGLSNNYVDCVTYVFLLFALNHILIFYWQAGAGVPPFAKTASGRTPSMKLPQTKPIFNFNIFIIYNLHKFGVSHWQDSLSEHGSEKNWIFSSRTLNKQGSVHRQTNRIIVQRNKLKSFSALITPKGINMVTLYWHIIILLWLVPTLQTLLSYLVHSQHNRPHGWQSSCMEFVFLILQVGSF